MLSRRSFSIEHTMSVLKRFEYLGKKSRELLLPNADSKWIENFDRGW